MADIAVTRRRRRRAWVLPRLRQLAGIAVCAVRGHRFSPWRRETRDDWIWVDAPSEPLDNRRCSRCGTGEVAESLWLGGGDWAAASFSGPRFGGKTDELVRWLLANPTAMLACSTQDAADRLVARGVPAGQILVSTPEAKP